MTIIRQSLLAAASASALLIATGAHAQSATYTTPNITTAAGATSVTFRGYTFVNQGLIGVGRVSATGRDFANETLGSFSGMAMDLSSWRRNSNGSYSGSLWTLPDRGPNDVGPFVGTTNYRNRIHTYSFSLNPYTSSTPLPASTSSQNQLQLTPTGGFFLTDATGTNFTGRDAGSNVVVRDGISYPVVAAGDATGAAGRISMDSEALVRSRDGSFYVSDEYGAMIYHFDATGRQIGAIQTIAAILPRTAGVINFDGGSAPTTGRRNNQGLEALAITPDGRQLVTILQSATVQDTSGSSQQTRNNTRILVYNISGTGAPTSPTGHFVLQLPTFNVSGLGASANRTAAQSEMLALNSTQFLVLSRDGVGRGSGASPVNSPVYKSVLLVDTFGATNLAGTAYETGVTPIATGGALVSGITPVSQVELVNMLNPVQLGRFGMNLNTAPSDILSMSEKWEALGLVPVLDEAAPQDFFLLVGNDNDFMASNGSINGQAFDASLTGAGGTGNNDSIILVYRLTLPTYVDPEALDALNSASPYAVSSARDAGRLVGGGAIDSGLRSLDASRRSAFLGRSEFGAGANVWVEGAWRQDRVDYAGPTADYDGSGGAVGIDVGYNGVRVGGVFVDQRVNSDMGGGFSIDAEGIGAGLYVGAVLGEGGYVQAAASYSNLDFDDISRPAAYGQIAKGSTSGKATEFSVEAGFTPTLGGFRAGPFVSAALRNSEVDGYGEHGASVSNATYQRQRYESTEVTGGFEAYGQWAGLTPSLRIGYTAVSDSGSGQARVRLTSAMHPMADVVVDLPGADDDFASARLGLDGDLAGFQYRLQVESRFGDGDTDTAVSVGVARRF
ncbi:MAG: esterase-like activity of phytase family protein [Caulobacter sp.]